MLNELKEGMTSEEILRRADSAFPKLWVTYCALSLRGKHPEWFGPDAGYTPLPATGPRAEHVVGFMRGPHVATIVPRWPHKVGDNWGATVIELPAGEWRNTLTGDVLAGGRVRVQALLREFPVALLVKEPS